MKKIRLYCLAVWLGVAMPMMAATEPNTVVRLETNYGNILIELFPQPAPTSVSNFLHYVGDDFYDGLIFHRVIKNFVIQAGAYDPNLTYKTPEAPIKNESNNGLKNRRGTVAMARTSDPNSATSQFYINTVDNTSLDYVSSSSPGYAVFGEVIGGMTVVDAISNVATHTQNSLSDVPVQPVIITKATQLDPNDIDSIHVDQLTTYAGQGTGHDGFMIRGEFRLTPQKLDQADVFEVHLGPWTTLIDANDIDRVGTSSIYIYYGDPNSITLAWFDLNAGTFLMQARDIDLAGLKDPPDFQIIAGSYFGTKQVPKSVINLGKGVPLTFLHGLEDALKVNTFVHVNDPVGKWLYVNGSISTQYESDLAELTDPNDVTISNDPNDMKIQAIQTGTGTTIPTHTIHTFTRLGSGHVYMAKEMSANLLWAYFDMDRGVFAFFIKNAPAWSSSAKLKISFPIPSLQHTFSQEVSMK